MKGARLEPSTIKIPDTQIIIRKTYLVSLGSPSHFKLDRSLLNSSYSDIEPSPEKEPKNNFSTGRIHTRVLSWLPPPQVVEHDDHSVHSV